MSIILRLPQALAASGKTKSPWYADITRGLMTRPVKIGQRAAGYPAHEVCAINAARIAGRSEDEIRALVERLHKARNEAAKKLTLA